MCHYIRFQLRFLKTISIIKNSSKQLIAKWCTTYPYFSITFTRGQELDEGLLGMEREGEGRVERVGVRRGKTRGLKWREKKEDFLYNMWHLKQMFEKHSCKRRKDSDIKILIHCCFLECPSGSE
jgi:hypothetical protein